MTAHDSAPDFRYISRNASQANFAMLRAQARLDEVTTITVPGATNSAAGSTMNASTKMKSSTTSTLAQQEKEFLKAVQPGSPISVLLRSARQPLVMSTSNTRDSPLIRKLQAAKLDGKSSGRSPSCRGVKDVRLPGGLGNINEEMDEEELVEELRKKELESQKARIVAQMVPNRATTATFAPEEQENFPPMLKLPKGKAKAKESAKPSVATGVYPLSRSSC
jgi:cell cycle serine/threonine-protein kinase CDC5/MSD2